MQKLLQLEAKVKELEERHRKTDSMVTIRQLTVTRKQLKALDTDRAQHALLRTKQQYYVRPTTTALDKDITPTEVLLPMPGYSNGQSASMDSAEFYKDFWDLLAPVLARLYNGFAAMGSLTPRCS
ncbi:hypothetical protein NDU88_007732 [Pleurodeles waltl]|uniref:Uncharacterized protein n=1 Tax=Pleurodeles waltl TaxID=8319 RepID=A0AAV7STM3_PLEWA|nr:hypothetical protein NDU88_007732 [Pleurodeles waltl]